MHLIPCFSIQFTHLGWPCQPSWKFRLGWFKLFDNNHLFSHTGLKRPNFGCSKSKYEVPRLQIPLPLCQPPSLLFAYTPGSYCAYLLLLSLLNNDIEYWHQAPTYLKLRPTTEERVLSKGAVKHANKLWPPPGNLSDQTEQS